MRCQGLLNSRYPHHWLLFPRKCVVREIYFMKLIMETLLLNTYNLSNLVNTGVWVQRFPRAYFYFLSLMGKLKTLFMYCLNWLWIKIELVISFYNASNPNICLLSFLTKNNFKMELHGICLLHLQTLIFNCGSSAESLRAPQ